MVTFRLSEKTRVGYCTLSGVGEVKRTLLGMTCPSITSWSIKCGLGSGCNRERAENCLDGSSNRKRNMQIYK